MRTFFIIVLLFIYSGTASFAQNVGFDLLNISPSSYALGKSEATVSIPDGAGSIYNNPALLVHNSASSLDLSYTFWVADIKNVFGGINLVNGNQALAFSFYSSGADDYQQYNRPGSSNGNFSVQYLSLAAGYAYDIKGIAAGISAQYLREDVFTYQASGYAINMGLSTGIFNDKVRFGTSIVNLGEMDKLNAVATEIPASFKLGLSADLFGFSLPKNESLPVEFSVAADFIQPLRKQEQQSETFSNTTDDHYFNLAVSFTVSEALELSSGYRSGKTSRPYSFGVSFLTDDLIFKYALLPFETGFGTAHSLGLQYKF